MIILGNYTIVYFRKNSNFVIVLLEKTYDFCDYIVLKR